jgi:hypothetical protein
MPKIKYDDIRFSADKLDLIGKANTIIEAYQKQGFNLTLRQLYYQFVARDLLPGSWADKNGVVNRPESYSKLGDLISDARLAGLVDWYAIVDRSRSSYANQHWEKPSDIMQGVIYSYATDKWKDQPNYVECWVEKEALEDVLNRACQPLDVRYFACKGYTSQSSMWEASQRLLHRMEEGKQAHIVHLGDHDPSGIDMSRDIFARLNMFTAPYKVKVKRIALNMAQVKRYNPPPNPAKTTDSRFAEYQKNFGDESWELDALDPNLLVELITYAVKQFRDEKLWDAAIANEERGRGTLKAIHARFPEVVKFLREK